MGRPAVLLLLLPCVFGLLTYRNTGNLVVLYTFSEQTGTIVYDRSFLQKASPAPYWNSTMQATQASWTGEPAGVLITNGCGGSCTTAPVYDGTNTGDLSGYFSGNKLTMELWVKPSSTSQAILAEASNVAIANTDVLCSSYPDQGTLAFRIMQTASGAFAFTVQDFYSGSRYCVTCQSPTPAVVGTLYHVVGVVDLLSHPRFFINNVEIDCTASTYSLATPNLQYGSLSPMKLALGGRWNGLFTWVGRMYLAALYNDALTPAQITQNYNAGPYNDRPVAQTGNATVLENAFGVVRLNATSLYDIFYNATITALPSVGTLYQCTGSLTKGAAITVAGTVVTNANNYVIFEPPTNTRGSPYTTFGYTMTNTQLTSAQATVTVNVVSYWAQPVTVAGPAFSANYGTETSVTGFSVSSFSPGTITVIVQANQGLLSLASTTGLTFTLGDGSLDTALMFTSTAAAATAALATLTYTALQESPGAVTFDAVSIYASDSAAFGSASTPNSAVVSVSTVC